VIFPLVSGPFVSYNEVNCQSMRCICFVPTLPVNPPTLLLRYRIQKYICALIFCQRCTPSTVLTSVEGTIEWQVRRTLQQNLPSLVRRDKPRASQSMIGGNRESGSLDGASVDRCYQSSEYQCHSLILPYEKPMLQSIYNGYLDPSNPEVLGNQHPKCPVAPILQKHAPAFLMHLVKLRNIMVKHLTKSGTHTTDAFEYCDTVM
jgi:hypothetical protein